VKPEEALDAARAAAAAARARGAYAEDLSGFRIEPTDRVGTDLLMEWAIIEPDERNLRSTRRLGGPITWIKKLMLRGLQQHFNDLLSQESRFNLHILVHVTELEDRVDHLEKELAELRGPDAS
jgi:hypothetical protein